MMLARPHGRLHYEIYGQGDAVIFLNGFASGISNWYPVIRGIRNDYQCVLYDYVGTGDSPSFEDYEFSLESYCADLLALIDAIGQKSVHLVGYSMGGWIAQYFVAQRPSKVISLTLVNTSPKVSLHQYWVISHFLNVLRDSDIGVFSKLMFISYYSPEYFDKNAEKLDRMKNLADLAFAKQKKENWMRIFNSFMSFNVESSFEKFNIPTLLVSGEQDFLCPRTTALRFKSLMADLKWIELKSVGHAIPMERYQELRAAIAEFLPESISMISMPPTSAA